jgi:hemolysin III
LQLSFVYHGERFNSSTHLVGTALAITGSALLITRAALEGDPWKIVSFSLFGTVLVVLYAISTLYHSIRASGAKALFRRLDHCAIYLLIAGTYTPICRQAAHSLVRGSRDRASASRRSSALARS